MRAKSQTQRAIRQGRKRDLAMENQQLAARVTALETALKPFTLHGYADWPDHTLMVVRPADSSPQAEADFTMGDVNRARKLLAE